LKQNKGHGFNFQWGREKGGGVPRKQTKIAISKQQVVSKSSNLQLKGLQNAKKNDL